MSRSPERHQAQVGARRTGRALGPHTCRTRRTRRIGRTRHPGRTRCALIFLVSSLESMLVVACAGGSNGGDVIAGSDSAAVADSAAAAGSLAATGSDAECPEMGEWRTCSVEKRLERAGFVAVRQDTAVRHPFLAVPGTVYRLGADELQVFLYPSAEARTRDLAGVDSATVSPRGARVRWSAAPTLIVSNNLAAVLIGGTSRQVERVVLALTAGLPQP